MVHQHISRARGLVAIVLIFGLSSACGDMVAPGEVETSSTDQALYKNWCDYVSCDVNTASKQASCSKVGCESKCKAYNYSTYKVVSDSYGGACNSKGRLRCLTCNCY